jgi:hypothetical protein
VRVDRGCGTTCKLFIVSVSQIGQRIPTEWQNCVAIQNKIENIQSYYKPSYHAAIAKRFLLWHFLPPRIFSSTSEAVRIGAAGTTPVLLLSMGWDLYDDIHLMTDEWSWRSLKTYTLITWSALIEITKLLGYHEFEAFYSYGSSRAIRWFPTSSRLLVGKRAD